MSYGIWFCSPRLASHTVPSVFSPMFTPFGSKWIVMCASSLAMIASNAYPKGNTSNMNA